MGILWGYYGILLRMGISPTILPFENSSLGDIMGYVMDTSHKVVQEPCRLMFSIIVIEWGFNHEQW